MEKLSEIQLKENQVAVIVIPVYKANQKIAEMTRQNSDEKTQQRYREKEYSQEALMAATQETLQETLRSKLIENERKRMVKLQTHAEKIGGLLNQEPEMLNLDFMVWNYNPGSHNKQENRSRVNGLKTAYERVRGPEAIFEVQMRLWHDLQNHELITPLWFFMDLTLHHEKKFNLLFLMEDEKYWINKFFSPVLPGNKRMRSAKIHDISIMILDF